MKCMVSGLFLILFALQSEALSLFSEKGYKSLIYDSVAYQKGDLLTVMVLETAQAESRAELSSGKEVRTNLEAGIDALQKVGKLGFQGRGKVAAQTGRTGKMKAALTVAIKEVLPNGCYRVAGSQRMYINGELQTIALRGIVRKEDIRKDNTLLSSRLAEAQIHYQGRGAVSISNNRNFLYKLLSLLGVL